MAVELSDLKEQIEKAKESLKSVDENIKKITGRDPNEPRPGAEGRRLSAGGPRGRDFGTVLGRRNRDVQERTKDSEPPRKRVAVFSRLGAAAGGRRVVLTGRRTSKHEEINDEEDEEEQATKPAIQSSVVSTAKQITKNELISAQNVGEKGKARNRRMFGMLLGTLARFDKDSRGRQSKQVQKQKEVETRLEEETAEERKNLASQRRTLFNERRSQQKRIQLLEQKIALADELTEWEKEWNKKSNFIMTKASPSIFFMPKDFTPRTQRALQDSKGRIKEIIEKHKKSLEETMNAYDDEINILEGKQENEDGKGDKNLEGNNLGSRVLNSRKRGVNEEEPEEEMDLDSMEPQVDIKVEMDENEAEEGENGGVSNGVQSTEIKQKIDDALHPDNQNHDIAMEEEEEGEAERTQESKDQQIVMKQEAPNVIADDVAWKETEDKPNDEPVEKQEVMQVDIDLNVVTGRSGEEQQEKPVQNEQEEDTEALPPGVVGDQKQESYSETENATESLKPGEEDCDNREQDSLREKGVNEDKMVETTELVKSEESDCKHSVEKQTDKSETTTAEMEKDALGKTVSTQAHSSSSDSENDVKFKSSKEAALKKKSSDDEFGRTAHGKQNLKQQSREKSLPGDSRKESKDEKKDSRTKQIKTKKSSSEHSSYEKEQIKRKEKEPVGRKGSASECKVRVGKRRKSETSSESESSSESSSSSENDRRNKRSSASHGDGKRRSRERQVSRRSSGGSRQRSRSKSRERQTNRRDRRRR